MKSIVITACCIFLLIGPASAKQDGTVRNKTMAASRVARTTARQAIGVEGIFIKGVKRGIATKKKIVALTLDACAGRYNAQLIRYLEKKQIPATLFLTGRWIKRNRETARYLSKHPLFEIENHGLYHRPCITRPVKIYGIQSTGSIHESSREIEENAKLIQSLNGKRPRFYRPGTAYIDSRCVSISYKLGHVPMAFTLSPGDAERHLSAQVLFYRITRRIRPGSVILMHMNHPGNATLPALKAAIPWLKKKGYRFVKLEEVSGNLE